jgi:hypothetical protein
MEFGPQSAVYVAAPAFGANNGEGRILQFDLSSDAVIEVDDTLMTGTECAA